MRILRVALGAAVIAALLAFVWGLLAPRRKVPTVPTPTYVAPEPASDESVSVPDAVPLQGG